jgi:hypothetical protein
MSTMSTVRGTLVIGSALALSGLCTLASCAETDATSVSEEDGSIRAPSDDGGADGSADATVDAPTCDSGDPDCVTTPIACADAAWCPVASPLSPFALLTAVWGWSKNDVLAVGSGGTVLRWDGTIWSKLPSPSAKDTFFAVWGTSASDMWLASGTNALFHATTLVSGAPEWKAEPNLTGERFSTPAIYAGWSSGAGDVRVGGSGFQLDGPNGFVACNQFVRGAPAADWAPVEGEGRVRGIWGSSPTDVWLLVDNSEMNAWQKGKTVHGTGPAADDLAWSVVDSQAAVGLLGIWGSSANDVWAVGESGTLRHMTPGALRWSIVPSPTTETLRAIWGSSATDIWAVGGKGTILHYDGTTWKPSVAAFPVGAKPELYGVWGSGPGDVWIVGDGIVLHSTKLAGGGS